MTLGFDRPLYVLPFDHRGSFETGMFGWKGALTTEQTARIADAKRVIYDGFKAAVATGVPKQKAGILVDEQFGAAILRDAKAEGFTIACPAEKSGQDEFDFEYGEAFDSHIEAFQPTFCKVLVRYNPEGNQALNRRQTDRLRRLSDYLHTKSRSLFMFELLVPPEKAQLDEVNGDKLAYDLEIRPRLMIHTIEELQDAHVEPDVWKIEGLDRREDCETIVATARRGGRDKVSCIVLGRGENDQKVREWITTAAAVPGFIGFAVGRSDFWQPLVAWLAKRATREAAVDEIARRYREFVDIFERAHAAQRPGFPATQADRKTIMSKCMRVGIATDHGGFLLKEELLNQLRAAGHDVVDFGAHELNPSDDYPDIIVPLARAVAAGTVLRGIAICGSGVGASVCANKVVGVRAGLVHDHFSAQQGVEDDNMNVICMGGRTVGPSVAWDLVQAFLACEFSGAERHIRRLAKVAFLEARPLNDL